MSHQPAEPPKDFRLFQKLLLIALVFGTPLGIWYWNHDKQSSASTTFPSVTLGALTAATSTSFTCGVSTVKDADNNVYNTVLIGSQCWMKQSMRVGTYVPISATTTYQTNNGTIEKWCYNNTPANCTANNPNQPDGGLYQWNEAMQYVTTPGARGICPSGWHIPTHDEYTTMERAVCVSGTSTTCTTDFPYNITTTGIRGTIEGTKLKPNGTSGWEGNLAGSGWSGSFYFRGQGGSFWSSSESGGNAWYRLLDSAEARVFRSTGVKADGYSVRCLRDSPATTINQTISNPTLDTGLVGHWTFDGPNIDWSSTTAEIRDTSPYHNNGDATSTMSSQKSATPGVMGQGMKFDGVKDYLNAGHASSLADLGPMTASFWINGNATPNGMILYKGASTPITSGWSVELSNGYPVFRAAYSGFGIIQMGTTNLQTDGWHQVALVWDGSTNIANVDFFRDGIPIQTSDGMNASGVKNFNNSLDLYIGMAATGEYKLSGVLDDVRIYNRALSAAEVKRLYDLGQGVTVRADIVCGASTVKDADGNVYNTVKIGEQCWMKQNMRVGTMVTAATTQTNNSTIEKWCYSDTLANCMTNNNPNYPDGGLYQWNEAMQYVTTPGARGICPAGFHIPTDAEWHTLENHLKDSGQTCDASRLGVGDCPTAGTKLKANGVSRWEGNLAGYGETGAFYQVYDFGYFWSSSDSGGLAWYRSLFSGSTQVNRNTFNKSVGFSIRCLKDS